jgi:hypothetical protein
MIFLAIVRRDGFLGATRLSSGEGWGRIAGLIFFLRKPFGWGPLLGFLFFYNPIVLASGRRRGVVFGGEAATGPVRPCSRPPLLCRGPDVFFYIAEGGITVNWGGPGIFIRMARPVLLGEKGAVVPSRAARPSAVEIKVWKN